MECCFDAWFDFVSFGRKKRQVKQSKTQSPVLKQLELINMQNYLLIKTQDQYSLLWFILKSMKKY